ncbi:MAG: cell wall-active antibiotics response protein [Gemmatimonadota bacterium]|nr:cell wall-active antibiotics response protein [Gemmatimonadota bacterium]
MTALAALLPMGARAQSAPLWRNVDISRQLRDTAPQRIRVQYGAGRVDVRGTSDPTLYAMHLRYDEARSTPLHRYDAAQHSTALGLESRGGTRMSGGEAGELRLTLARAVPLDLDMEFGGTQATLDLGEMSLQSVRLDCGAADAMLLFSRPNRLRMRDLEVNVGAADFTGRLLANANADQIRVRGGLGSVDLDFNGTWTHDLTVVTRLAVGKLTLHVPADVGLRVELQRIAAGFDHVGLVKRDDAWYSPNYDTAPFKLKVRAETFFGGIDIQRSTR